MSFRRDDAPGERMMKVYLFPNRYSECERHAEHLELGRRAVDQCDHITEKTREQQKKVDTLQGLAEFALKQGDRDLALQLLREKVRYEREIAPMGNHLSEALENLEVVTTTLNSESVILDLKRKWAVRASIPTLVELMRKTVALAKEYSPFPMRNPDNEPFSPKLPELRSAIEEVVREYYFGPETSSPENAVQRRTEQHQQNLARGLQAATQCNNLMEMVRDHQKKVDTLQAKANEARKRGDLDLALQLLKEKQSYEMALEMTRENFGQALETLDAILIALEALYPVTESSGENNHAMASESPLPSNSAESVEQILSPSIPSPKRKRGGKQSKRYR